MSKEKKSKKNASSKLHNVTKQPEKANFYALFAVIVNPNLTPDEAIRLFDL